LCEQITAVENMARWLKQGGKLILIEGYRDGFDALNRLRKSCDTPPLVSAPINYYSYFAELQPTLERWFELADNFHTGMFDFLNRVVYPRVIGPEQIDVSGAFHRRIEIVARNCNLNDMRALARVRGLALIKR